MILVRVICFVNVQKWFYTFTYHITPLVDTFPHFFKKWNPCQWLFFLIWINKFPFRLGNWTLKKDLHLLLSRINWRSSKFRILNKIILPKIAFLSLPRIPSKIVKKCWLFWRNSVIKLLSYMYFLFSEFCYFSFYCFEVRSFMDDQFIDAKYAFVWGVFYQIEI